MSNHTNVLPAHVMPVNGSWITILERQGDLYWSNDGCPRPDTADEVRAALATGLYVDAAPFIAECEAFHAGR